MGNYFYCSTVFCWSKFITSQDSKGVERDSLRVCVLHHGGAMISLWTVHGWALPHIYWFRIKKVEPRSKPFYKASSKIMIPITVEEATSQAVGDILPVASGVFSYSDFCTGFRLWHPAALSRPLSLFSAFLILCHSIVILQWGHLIFCLILCFLKVCQFI